MRRLEIQEICSEEFPAFGELSLIVFDGEWLSEYYRDIGVHTLLREASRKGAKLVAVGGLTSKFLEALDEAGVNQLSRDEEGDVRNPAYDNPPLVGFRLKTATTPDGKPYQYPSILASNTNDIQTMVESLVDW
ncbi:MAG: hypothetical protein QXF52_06705 [Thermoproteota archaeon]